MDIVAHDMADGRHRAGGARSAMLALVEIVQQVRLLSLLERGDPLAVTIRDQCLAALDGNRSEALALLARLRDDELSRPDATVAAIGQIQQALRCVESMSSARGWTIIPARRERAGSGCAIATPQGVLLCAAKCNSYRDCAFGGRVFLVLAGWPASALALTITAIVCALSTTMPDPSKAVVAAMASFALAAVSADIVRFYFLTDSQDFIRLAIAIAPMMIFGCLLSVNPKIAGIGVMMNIIFLFLLAPSNPTIVQRAQLLFAMHVRGICPRCRISGVPPGVAGIGARQTTRRRQGDGGNIGGVGDRQEIQPAGAEHRAGLQDFRLCCRGD